jgi:hypothetical protein
MARGACAASLPSPTWLTCDPNLILWAPTRIGEGRNRPFAALPDRLGTRGGRELSALRDGLRGLQRITLRAVKPISRSKWNDGVAADSGPSRGDRCRGALRQSETFLTVREEDQPGSTSPSLRGSIPAISREQCDGNHRQTFQVALTAKFVSAKSEIGRMINAKSPAY